MKGQNYRPFYELCRYGVGEASDFLNGRPVGGNRPDRAIDFDTPEEAKDYLREIAEDAYRQEADLADASSIWNAVVVHGTVDERARAEAAIAAATKVFAEQAVRDWGFSANRNFMVGVRQFLEDEDGNLKFVGVLGK